MAAADALPQRGAGFRVARAMRTAVAEPSRWWRTRSGIEDFDFPGTPELTRLAGRTPDLLHLHNLHGGYFDLRCLPRLSARVPTIVTMHDAWLLTGHCAHSLGCDRWKAGCGECPALWIYPAIARDATAANFRRKAAIYAASRVYVGVPSVWLAAQVRESMLLPAVRELRVIPHGVDLGTFLPGPGHDRSEARRLLDLDPAQPMVLTSAAALHARSWRDAETFRHALRRLSGMAAGARWIAIGEAGPDERIGAVTVERRAAESDDRRMAQWYRAADVYVHAARADTFPYMVIESLACGTPVIGTAVGGIPEQVRGDVRHGAGGVMPAAATGILVRPADAAALARAIAAFFAMGPSERAAIGRNAAADAATRFDLGRQARAYMEWVDELTGQS